MVHFSHNNASSITAVSLAHASRRSSETICDITHQAQNNHNHRSHQSIEIFNHLNPLNPLTLGYNSSDDVKENRHMASNHLDIELEPKTSPIAWLLLVCFVLLRAATSIFSNTFSPIPTVIADYMGVSLTGINGLFNVTTIVYFVACFFTSWLFQRIGAKRSLILSGLLLTLGCWIRWISVKTSSPSFPILLVGQVIASFSSPISLNLTTTLAKLWFTENRRSTAVAIMLSNPGTLIAVLLLPQIATGAEKIEFTLILIACIASVCTVPLFFFPSKPRTPTSYDLVEKSDSVPKQNLREGVAQIIKNPHFLVLFVVFSLSVGLNNAWGAVINQAITPYGYTDDQVGIIAAVGVVGQTIGFFVAGPILDKTKQHLVLLKMIVPLMFSTYLALIFIVKADSFASIIYVNFLSQFSFSIIVPICIDMGVEVSYPLPESLSTSILWQCSQVFSVIFVTLMDLLRDHNGTPQNNMSKALILQASLCGICLLFTLFFNGPMKRTMAIKTEEDLRNGLINRRETDYNSDESTIECSTSKNKAYQIPPCVEVNTEKYK